MCYYFLFKNKHLFYYSNNYITIMVFSIFIVFILCIFSYIRITEHGGFCIKKYNPESCSSYSIQDVKKSEILNFNYNNMSSDGEDIENKDMQDHATPHKKSENKRKSSEQISSGIKFDNVKCLPLFIFVHAGLENDVDVNNEIQKFEKSANLHHADLFVIRNNCIASDIINKMKNKHIQIHILLERSQGDFDYSEYCLNNNLSVNENIVYIFNVLTDRKGNKQRVKKQYKDSSLLITKKCLKTSIYKSLKSFNKKVWPKDFFIEKEKNKLFEKFIF